VGGTRDAVPVRSDVAQETCGGLSGTSWETHHEGNRVFRGGERPSDLNKAWEDRRIHNAERGQEGRAHDVVGGVTTSTQGLAQVRDLCVERALGPFREHLGSVLPSDERLDHRPAAGSHHSTHDRGARARGRLQTLLHAGAVR
jgi:hypothetical protein